MDEEVEVGQGQSQLGAACSALHTSGLGPCIGVAFVHNGEGYMMHYPAPHENDDAEVFFQNIASYIPVSDRSLICPVVAGGRIGADEDPKEVRYTADSRNWVTSQLSKHGFGTPQIHWCPPDANSQDMYLRVQDNVLELVTWFDRPDEIHLKL